jgi:hypothetical protein
VSDTGNLDRFPALGRILAVPLSIVLLSVIRTLIELAGFVMFAQALVWFMSGPRRSRNPVYRLCRYVTSPIIRATRAVTPSVVSDGHVPFIAFVLLFWFWALLGWAKLHLCGAEGLAC